MKLFLGALLVDTADALSTSILTRFSKATALRKHSSTSSSLQTDDDRDASLVFYGDTKCPCIGFDNIDGDTEVELDDGRKVLYPGDLGARCEKWDDPVHPSCQDGQSPGPGNDWCGQSWCYVDSCNCDIPVLPKTSAYAPDARYRGRPVFFSYATCGGEDAWSKELPIVGTAGCRCIGFDNMEGTIDVKFKSQVVGYPQELGGSCTAWDEKKHPLCRGSKPPAWCKAKWCYVDPCACSLDAPPKVTMYLPKATFTGKSLYYSYATCGSKDTFTKRHNRKACVNQKSKEVCEDLTWKNGATKCAWTGSTCLGAELVNHPLCKKALPEKDGSSSMGFLVGVLVAATSAVLK